MIGKVSPKLGDACLKLWNNTELVSYLFVGVATTLVNYIVYYLATRVAGLDVMPGTWTAWVFAVAFGYVANKAFVFHTHCENMLALVREAGSFFAMRLASLGIETVLMFLLVGGERAGRCPAPCQEPEVLGFPTTLSHCDS